ncbi:MAG: long-chain fatty acid--CoA ligase [Myxococcales bacterium]|nr:long-chain fatty acid--CoA ligase [Myxococcales bacterium]MCB9754029.1 long-chain fatty acid--CoA ligase [Myxococcales bacterium]
MADKHLAQMFFDRAREGGAATAYTFRRNGKFAEISWTEAADRVEAIAAGALTLGLTLDKSMRAAIVANTRVEWPLIDFAMLSLGLETVPIYMSLLVPEVGYVLQDTKAQLAFAEDKQQLEKLRAAREGFRFFDKDYAGDTIEVKKIIVLDVDGIAPADDWMSLADLEKAGKAALDETRADRRRRMDEIKREDVATYVYTSGTTGPPKAVIQTHENHLSFIENVDELQMFNDEVKVGGAFLFLPLAHSFARLIEFGAVFYTTKLVLAGIQTIAEDLQESRPGFVPAAPRVYERIYGKIMTGVQGASPVKKALFNWSLSVGKKTIPYLQRGSRSYPLLLSLQYKLADKLVLSKIRERLGLDRCVFMLSGSAPLPSEIHEFFAAAGLVILEAYGLTETCPGLTSNRPDHWKIGSVGPALKGVTLKIASDGEILAKGPNITQGYLNRPDANADAFEDGWFLTGDIGEFDADGFLKITDRKKDLIKTSGGKYVAPQKIEGRVITKPLVSQCVVIGDLRKYCVALITLDAENLQTWSQQTGNPPDPKSQVVQDIVQEYIDDVNKGLASFETIKYFRIVDEEFSVDNGMLTASFKVKRRVVAKRYESLINSMYQS